MNYPQARQVLPPAGQLALIANTQGQQHRATPGREIGLFYRALNQRPQAQWLGHKIINTQLFGQPLGQRRRAHITGRGVTLLQQPTLIIKGTGIDKAPRASQTQNQLPTLPRLKILCRVPAEQQFAATQL